MTMRKKTDSLLFKFAMVFAVFTVVILTMTGLVTYHNQTAAYHLECEERIQKVGRILESLVVAEGQEFLDYQDYFMAYHRDMLIPYNFRGDYIPAREKFYRLFTEQFPGKIYGRDVKFADLPESLKMLYAVYNHERWLSIFEKINDVSGTKYAYYIVPSPEPWHMTWMIDCVREQKEFHGVTYIDLGTDVLEPLEKHQKMWEAWETGKRPLGYDIYDDSYDYGMTYAYYTPVIIDGRKSGVIGVEISIDEVNSDILRNTVRQMLGIGLIIFLGVAATLWFINRRYIKKLSSLRDSVHEYAASKKADIAVRIEREASGQDEIAALSMQVAAMMLELENYMKSLISTSLALNEAREHVDALSEKAMQDALTGIGNKAAYDREVGRLEWEIDSGRGEFAIAVIDMNFLKRINDTFGHEQGNVAIKRLADLICDVFKESPQFRIGGDEFAVIMEGEYCLNSQALKDEFNRKLAQLADDPLLEPWEKVSAAIGIAVFDRDIDSSVANVFKRADKIMYANKKAMKAVRLD